MDGAGVIQSGDFEIQSSHETPEEMRQALAVNEPATDTPVEDAPESTEKPDQAEPPKPAPPQGDRDPQTGQFKKPAKPRNDPQARIDQAIAKQREAERRAEAAERRAAEIEAQRKSEPPPPAPTPKPQPPPPPRAASVASDPNDPEPDHTDLTKYPDGQFDLQFIKDLNRWGLRQERRAEQQRLAEEAHWKSLETHAAKFAQRLDEAEAADPGFMARAYQPVADAKPISVWGPEDYARLQTLPPGQRNQIAFHALLAEEVFQSEHPRELLLHLNEPGVIQRLATLHPKAITRELAFVEARLGAATSAAPAPKPEVSHAKPPIQPLGSSPHAADPNELSEDLPIEEWIKRGNAKERASGRR